MPSPVFLNNSNNFFQSKGEEGAEVPAADVLPLTDAPKETTEKADKAEKSEKTEKGDKEGKPARQPRERRERGPPADGIPSKNKVMAANLPYDLSEEKVRALNSIFLSPG